MAGYYLVMTAGYIHNRFESADDADDFIEGHMRRFPRTQVPERVWVEV